MVEFCGLLTSYWKLILLQAVPKLGDERKSLWWREATNFVRSEEFHAFKRKGKSLSGQ